MVIHPLNNGSPGYLTNKKYGACFNFNSWAWDDEIGDAPSEFETITNVAVPALNIKVDVGFTTFSQAFEAAHVSADFFDKNRFYNGSIGFSSPYGDACDVGISLSQGIKVIQSLQYLDPSETQQLEILNNVLEIGEF